MACRLFRELKLGLIVGPTPEEGISNLVVRDMGTIPPWQTEHSIELNSLGVQTGISKTPDACGDGTPSRRSIDLEDNESAIPVEVDNLGNAKCP